MMEGLFFAALIAYFAAVILQIVGVAIGRRPLTRAARFASRTAGFGLPGLTAARACGPASAA